MMREGLRELYARHHEFVWRVCWRYVQNSADADDLTHEVFVKAARGWRRFAGECAVTSWLYRVATNHCCDHVRKRHFQHEARERGAVDPCAGEWSFRAADPEGAADGGRDAAASAVLERLRHVLQGAERHIVYLRFDVGLPQHGISRITGLPRAAVRRRLARIVNRAALLFDDHARNSPSRRGDRGRVELRS